MNDEFNQILQRVSSARTFAEKWQKNIQKWRALYDMRPATAQINDEYRDPTHANAVDLAVGIILGNKMRWHAFGTNPSKREQKDTGSIEKLLQATWDVNNRREEKSNEYELILNFVRDGGGVLYSVFDPALAQEKANVIEVIDPESEEGTVQLPAFMESPIRVQVIDPNKLILLPGGPKRWLLIGRRERMSVLDVQINYPLANYERFAHLSEMDKSTVMGDFIDVWDFVTVDGRPVVRNTVIFEGIPLIGPRLMPQYPDLPYTIQFFKPVGEDPENWKNIMSAQESSVELLERAINRRSKQIDIYTALPLISKTQTGRVVQLDGGLFNHVNMGTDETIEFPKWQGNPPDVQVHVDFLRSRVNQSGFSEVMFGMGGDSAGYALAQQGDQNRIRLEQPIRHIELLLTTWARKCLDMLDVFAAGTSICIYGSYQGRDFNEHIMVDDFKGYAVSAEIRASFPAEETRKVAMATQAKGTLSNYTILERYFDIEQPEDEQDRQLIEIVSAHPSVVQYTIMKELAERAQDGDEVAAKVLEMMQNMEGQGAGRPENPNNPEQLTGTASPTGQPTPQEKGMPPPGQSAESQMMGAVGNMPKMGM